MRQRLFSDPFLTLVNTNPKKSLNARNSFKIRYFEKGLSKSLKKIISFFFSNPVPFKGQSCLKQKGPGTSDQLLIRLQNNFRKTPLLVVYYLTKFDDIM